jgi:hypothetical protein
VLGLLSKDIIYGNQISGKKLERVRRPLAPGFPLDDNGIAPRLLGLVQSPIGCLDGSQHPLLLGDILDHRQEVQMLSENAHKSSINKT